MADDPSLKSEETDADLNDQQAVADAPAAAPTPNPPAPTTEVDGLPEGAVGQDAAGQDDAGQDDAGDHADVAELSKGPDHSDVNALISEARALEDEIAQQDAEASPADPTPGQDGDTAADLPADRIAASEGSMNLPDFGGQQRGRAPTHSIDLLKDVGLQVKIELGRSRMLVEDVLRLGEGSVVELDKLAGDPVDVYVNDRLVARGEVLVLNDNFCVRVNEIVSNLPQDFQTA